MRIRLLKIFMSFIFVVLSFLLMFDVRILASDVEIVEGDKSHEIYEISCKSVVVKTDGEANIDSEALKQSVLNACELKGKDKSYLEVKLPAIEGKGVYPCEVYLPGTDVLVNVAITVVEKQAVMEDEKEEVVVPVVPVDDDFQDSIIIDGKEYEVLVRANSNLLGEKIVFSDGVNEYIGYFDWGFYLNAKPNFTFFIITISLMIVALVYVLIQNRNQREYWRYRGE